MNISYNWLKDLIDIDLSPEEVAKELTRVGNAVEQIHAAGDDFVLDVDLTSNRPDCLSHLGLARELSASLNIPLKNAQNSPANDIPVPSILAHDTVRIEIPELCHRFSARIIRGVKVGPSPDWLVKRLEAVGERSINNIADITNYVMMELGQPMHAFDLDKLEGQRIIVRTAKPGEKLTTLDGEDRELDADTIAICDAEKPAAIGGIIGGMDSSITDVTVNVLLEVAYFKRENIRATSRRLGVSTEASHRFERGVDIENIKQASDRAASLIVDLAGGELGEFIDIFPTTHHGEVVECDDVARSVRRFTGLDVDTGEAIGYLDRLGIESDESDTNFTAPSWRYDIAVEEDLVEEVARLYGYENIADELPPAFGAGEYRPGEERLRKLRQMLKDLGFSEAITYSFIDENTDGKYASIDKLSNDKDFVTLQAAVIDGAVRMRSTLIPGLLEALRHNLNHQSRDLALFETGKGFTASGDNDLPVECELLGLILTGQIVHENRAMPDRPVDFFDLKGAVESALYSLDVLNAEFNAENFTHLRRGQSASITVDGNRIGSLGRLSDDLAAEYKFKQSVFVAELDLGSLIRHAVKTPVYAPLSRFPASVRDISFVGPRNINVSELVSASLAADAANLQKVEFVDTFEGKGVESGHRSVTLRYVFNDAERTLLDDEVDAQMTAIISRVSSLTGCILKA